MTTYTDEQRDQAVTLSEEVGPNEAARQLGIPQRTLARWRTEAGVALPDPEKTANARAKAAERVATEWADYRSREATAAGATANRVRREIAERVDDGAAGRDVQALAIAYGILIDKAELLAGQATSRIEVWAQSELDRDLRGLVEEMEDRIREDSQGA